MITTRPGRGVKGNATGNAALGAAGHDPRLPTRICARGLEKPIRVAFDSLGYSLADVQENDSLSL
jgi:hypothetical protein